MLNSFNIEFTDRNVVNPVLYINGVGSGGGGGGGGQGGHVPPHVFDWGGNSMFVPLHF